MSSYSLSSLKSTTKYGIAGFIVGIAGAYSLCSIWSDSGTSGSSSSGSGYDDTSNQSSIGSMFGGGGGTRRSTKHRKKGHKKSRHSK
jgi:hypothetical protein